LDIAGIRVFLKATALALVCRRAAAVLAQGTDPRSSDLLYWASSSVKIPTSLGNAL
jgi:hypothetical protein